MRGAAPRAVSAAAVLLLAACASASPPAEPTLASLAVTASPAPTGTPSPDPVATASPAPTPLLELPVPGRPYDAAALLGAMRASRRPGGVPDQVETEAIAGAMAGEIWTFDGLPWPSLVIGGSCGPESCTIEVAGTPAGALGEDLYVFSVTPSNDVVSVLEASLRGLPTELLAELDAAARAVSVEDLGQLVLASARWLRPPEEGRFVLSNRSGGEEGTPALDVLLDVADGTATPIN